ncbi:DUF4412 domain-containing protein [Flavobacterium azooxidireducens]|uniref:DUF4412 domain-containing protein n=1 Tax=Flavobacterium azooxidireducens TaxID=1871076 RepID=A0ABY4KBC5_9FLAO|nr:DUF4412 domain-containing protein [Flavobacterium azooxidireducens]UPQ78087.1 DUF4412 domain-containing protein [Flavobacterium azooxidireducens]
MKTYSHILFLFLAIFACSQTAEAQFLDKLQKRAEERAQKRVEQKIERQVDKTVDKTVDAPEKAVKESKNSKKPTKKETKKAPTIDMNAMMNASESIEMPASYDFQKKVVYEIIDATSKQANQMTYWFGANEQVFGLETGYDINTFIVYDLSQEAMMMFSQKDKKVQVMPLSMFGAIYENAESDETDYTFKKVLGSKKINGYNCEKYVMTSETIEGEFWFTKEVDFKIADFSKTFLSMAKTSNQKVPQINPNENGFMMEMKAKDKSTNAVTQMTVKEFSNTKKTITTSTFKKS